MTDPIEIYECRVAMGEIERDPAQEIVIAKLTRLARELADESAPSHRGLGWILASRKESANPRGLYIFGSVGRGKTMLMDIFFEAAELRHKRRTHFHAFMRDIHARIHDWRIQRKAGRVAGDDPIGPAAEQIVSESRLICLDELSVTDITDAMILGRLFKRLFELGATLVATSNVAPERLYEGGLNRALFLPFIDLMRKRMDVAELAARTDFRLEKLTGGPVYFTPDDASARAALDRAFFALSGVRRGSETSLMSFGRAIRINEAAHNVARFAFADLCEQPLGAADYLEIARRFHTVLIDDIPLMGPEKSNEARRFVWLIDALYDMRVKLIASAAAQPDRLYRGVEGRGAMEFERTASRLFEMRAQSYLSLPHGRPASEASGDASGLAET